MAQKTKTNQNERDTKLKPLDQRIERLEMLFQKLFADFKEFVGILRDFIATIQDAVRSIGQLSDFEDNPPNESDAHRETRLALIDAKLESVDGRFQNVDARHLAMKAYADEGFALLFEKVAQLEDQIQKKKSKSS